MMHLIIFILKQDIFFWVERKRKAKEKQEKHEDGDTQDGDRFLYYALLHVS